MLVAGDVSSSGGGRGFSPRTRWRGSLMFTVWSWEAERELLIDRSPGKCDQTNFHQQSFFFFLSVSKIDKVNREVDVSTVKKDKRPPLTSYISSFS